MKTYDVVFHDSQDSNNKGFKTSFKEAKQFINSWNGTNHSYFADYKGGVVQIVCNETNKVHYETEVK